jgi:hypothetical protein
MRKLPWISYAWPGLAQLWYEGSWWGLCLASAFALLVNSLTWLSLVWVDVLSPAQRHWGWIIAGVLWLTAFVWGRHRGVRVSTDSARTIPANDLFPQAQREYLIGNWVDAEMLLAKLLRTNPLDVESRLLLATLFRRTNRPTDAAAQLDKLEKLEGAIRWKAEIAAERNHINELLPDPAKELAKRLALTDNRAQPDDARAA